MQLTNGTFLHGGTYKIDKVLGQGSFGITYLAVHTSLGKKVAIKEFFMKELNSRGDDGSITGMSDGSLSHNYGQKFKKEAINLSRLEHPNIVRVTDSFDENGTYYYVMDYIDGCNLNDYLKSNSVSQKEAVEIITDVAKALMYMHEEKHVLHLDLKPGNIMRRKNDGHIFLIDFGLSKHFSNDGQPETSTTIGLGTAGYAPVEQSNQAKNGEFRPTIDVYALGATLYKLLTGQTPPVASDLVSDDELLADSLAKYNVQGAIVDVVEKAMMPSVRKRTQSIRAFIDSLPNVNAIASTTTTTNNADTEETAYISEVEAGEETVFVNENREKHPNFEESTYVIEPKYKNYPTSTATKAQDGDNDAAIAYGMMALRGQGVKQDFDTAYSWFEFAKNNGDDRGEKMINEWTALKNKYNTTKTGDKDSKTKSKSEDSGSGTIVGIVFLVVFVIIIIVCARGCSNETEQALDYYAYSDTVDTVAVDTMAYSPAPITDLTEEIAPHKTKGGWRHSGTVITNYSEGSGLSVCKSKIDKNNACKNGCIIGSGKGVVIIGKNSFACEGVSDNIKSILEGYRSKGSRINDIAITPQGKYVIIEENNGYSNNTGIPELDKELSRANSARETIYSVSLTDGGKWAVITDAHYTSTGYFDVIETARKKYGKVRSISMTDKAVVVCCNRGVYYKNVPKKLAKDLDNIYWIPKYIKFCDGCTFLITDGKSAYWYYM